SFVRRELQSVWKDWLRDLSRRIQSDLSGVIPAATSLAPEQERFLERVTQRTHAIGRAYEAETFSMRTAARELCGLVHDIREFGRHADGLRGAKALDAKRKTSLVLEVAAAGAVAQAASPLMPRFAASLARALGREGQTAWMN